MVGSTPKSMNIYSPVSNNQEASLHATDSFNTVWVIDSFDPNDRFERQGEPVRAGGKPDRGHVSADCNVLRMAARENVFHFQSG